MTNYILVRNGSHGLPWVIEIAFGTTPRICYLDGEETHEQPVFLERVCPVNTNPGDTGGDAFHDNTENTPGTPLEQQLLLFDDLRTILARDWLVVLGQPFPFVGVWDHTPWRVIQHTIAFAPKLLHERVVSEQFQDRLAVYIHSGNHRWVILAFEEAISWRDHNVLHVVE